PPPGTQSPMTRRYSAKLLFQYRVDHGKGSAKRRTCEERIIVYSAATPASAIAEAKRLGRASECSTTNHDGIPWHIEFIGVMDIIPHGLEMEPETVWYDIRERLLPSERRASLVLSDVELRKRASEP
ncbi:MAG: DUF4288 domain-containing protein, partial [Tahibacter sp.]